VNNSACYNSDNNNTDDDGNKFFNFDVKWFRKIFGINDYFIQMHMIPSMIEIE